MLKLAYMDKAESKACYSAIVRMFIMIGVCKGQTLCTYRQVSLSPKLEPLTHSQVASIQRTFCHTLTGTRKATILTGPQGIKTNMCVIQSSSPRRGSSWPIYTCYYDLLLDYAYKYLTCIHIIHICDFNCTKQGTSHVCMGHLTS